MLCYIVNFALPGSRRPTCYRPGLPGSLCRGQYSIPIVIFHGHNSWTLEYYIADASIAVLFMLETDSQIREARHILLWLYLSQFWTVEVQG